MELSHWGAARTAFRESVQLALEMGNIILLDESLFNLALTCGLMGQHTEARQAVEQYLSKMSELGVSPDSVFGRWIRALSGNLFVWAGDLVSAERTLNDLKPWIESETMSRAWLWALAGLGGLYLAQGRPAQALPPLTRMVEVLQAAGSTGERIGPLLWCALAAHRTGDSVTAQRCLHQAEQTVRECDILRHNILLAFTRYELSGDAADLQAAHTEIQRQADQFTDDGLRSDFLSNVILHREIDTRWRAFQSTPQTLLTVRLARADAPLGKTLTDADLVEVRWTVDAGAADAEFLRRKGKVALRRHRLQRLIAEARAQGAAPTDSDLALALGVNVRTVERDMVALRKIGETAPTRRRK
jgi:tetratricopeptide (TPR) repeat protein